MRENDGRKIDHATLEQFRLRAVDQVKAGAHPEEVAKTLGLHRKTVYKWLAAERDGGREALLAKPIPGRPPLLSGEQMRVVYQWVAGGDPTQQMLDFSLWTRDLVRQLVKDRFGIEMSVWSVGRLLRRLGLSTQRPLRRAFQQDPVAVEEWKTVEYPKIAAEAKRLDAVVYFADEASVRTDYHSGTTWAPVGKTPVVKVTGARFSVNMVSAISAKGLLRFQIVEGRMTADKFIGFCKRLLRDAGKPVILIVDNHSVHRAKKVAEWVRSTDGRFKICYLPSYSPELNPDEWVWNNVKSARVGRAAPRSQAELKALTVSALRRLQRLPAVVASFFGDRDLAYIRSAEAALAGV